MANNRMYLVHVPSGLTVCIGKRMGGGWYMAAATGDRIAKLFDAAEAEIDGLDNFAIAMEDDRDAPFALGYTTLDDSKYEGVQKTELIDKRGVVA